MLAEAIGQGVDGVRADPDHPSDQLHRRAVYDAFGPVGDTRRKSARAWVSILAAERVLPVYEELIASHYGKPNQHPRKLIAVASQIAGGGRVNSRSIEGTWNNAHGLTTRPILDLFALIYPKAGGIIGQATVLQERSEVLHAKQQAMDLEESTIERIVLGQKTWRSLCELSLRVDGAYRSAYKALSEARGFEGINPLHPLREPLYAYRGDILGPFDVHPGIFADRRRLILLSGDDAALVDENDLVPVAKLSTEWPDLWVGLHEWGDGAATAALAAAWDPATNRLNGGALLAYWEWWYQEAVPAAWERAYHRTRR